MERVVSAVEMKWCDETTIKEIGIPGRLLMENAGSAVARLVCKALGDPSAKHVVIFCGKGNNGGDGFVVARHLSNAGVAVSVFLMVSPVEFKGDALANYTVLKKLSGRFAPPLTIERYTGGGVARLGNIDAIVDALFGTGFSGKVKEPALSVIRWINKQNVQANHTVTFGLRKTGLLLNNGREYAGNVEVADIGIPRIVTESKTLSRTFIISAEDVRSVLPRRPLTAHKYSVGKVFVLAGSKGYTGAAALCATSALRAGAGAVLLGTPEAVYPVLSRKLTEVIVMPLPSTDEGTLSEKGYGAIQPKLDWADVVVIGPGLSQHPEIRSLVVKILKEYSGRILLDADGLNAVAASGIGVLRRSKSEIILTPHSGEFSRLSGMSSGGIDAARIDAARSFARIVRKTIVLKGAPTVTASAEASVYVNSTGNPGMATIGSGDVLSGVVAGLWAQKMSAEHAAYSGVYLHGLAGDIAKNKFGERSLVAGDLVTMFPHALSIVENEGHV
jgi:hydroxyethylthiazole kinase-like uncharacterized protein yjeF